MFVCPHPIDEEELERGRKRRRGGGRRGEGGDEVKEGEVEEVVEDRRSLWMRLRS